MADLSTMQGISGQAQKTFSDYLRDKRALAEQPDPMEGINQLAEQTYLSQIGPQGESGAYLDPMAVFQDLGTFKAGAVTPLDRAEALDKSFATQMSGLTALQNLVQAGQPSSLSVADQLALFREGAELRDGQVVPREGLEQGQVFFSPKERVEKETELRKEFRTATNDVDFNKVKSNYENIKSAKPDAAGDLSLIFSYMKMLDPASTVREGEFANAQNATGVPGQIVNQYNKIIGGTRLNDKQREQFKGQAASLYNNTVRTAKQISEFYSEEANRFGIDPKSVVGVVGELEEVDVPEVAGVTSPATQQGGILDFFSKLLNPLDVVTGRAFNQQQPTGPTQDPLGIL